MKLKQIAGLGIIVFGVLVAIAMAWYAGAYPDAEFSVMPGLVFAGLFGYLGYRVYHEKP